MGAPAEPREELLGLVRALRERVQLDGDLGRPLTYLTGRGASPRPATVQAVPDKSAAGPGGGAAPDAKRFSLERVRELLGDCQRCKLAPLRQRLVFGEGSPAADLVFVGEAPGGDEDLQGKPFVGRAGQLLTKIIIAMGLERRDVYICNILKCRPPGNRNPLPEEIVSCEPFLISQLEAIKPRAICALGSFAARTLLKSETPITLLRGHFHDYQGIPLMPTYHPAYLLRNPGAKKQVWEDVQKIMELLRPRDATA